MTCTIFNAQCSEEFRDIIVGINCDNSELQVYHKNNGIVYKKQVNIWNPSLCYDDLINYYFSNNIIVISDYNGIYLYNNKLELKFNHIIRINDRFNDIYGFKAEKNGNNELICIKYWLMNNAPSQYLINSEFTNCSDINESKIFKYYFT